MKITLAVRHQGHVPSFKNNKRAIRLKRGGQKLVTETKTKAWMERCILGFESQLFCGSATIGGGMPTGLQQRFLIASSLPLDDSRQFIPELHVYCEEVAKGEEGAIIIIEKL
mgnify:CR=1 FL=1